MRKIYTGIIVSICFIAACNNSKETENNQSTSVDSTLQNSNTNASGTVLPSSSVSGSAESSTPVVSKPEQSAPAAPIATGINPAHGEPGHRCDISVGAPLDSPPATANSPSAITPSPVTTSPPAAITPAASSSNPVTPQAEPVVTAPGMNPPHGQPGHDCAIPAGSPLKKK